MPTLTQALDARTEPKFQFPAIDPPVKSMPFDVELTPELQYFPLDKYESLADWVEAIAQAQWAHIEAAIEEFLESPWKPYKRPAEDTSSPQGTYPSDVHPPFKSGWYHFREGNWRGIELSEIPFFMVSDTETCRETKTAPYKPFLFGGLATSGWYMWHCNEDSLPETVPFPSDRVVVGHNFAAYDLKFLSCEQAIANGRRTTVLDTLGLVTRYRGLSNQQTGRYKAAHAKVMDGGAADPWYQHASEGGLDHAVLRFLGERIDKGVRNAMTDNLWEGLYDAQSPTTVFEYWAQDIWYTSKLFKLLYRAMRHNFLPSTATWLGMAEMASPRVWLKDWDGFLAQSDQDWEASKSHLSAVVKAAADALLNDPEGPENYRQFKETVSFQSDAEADVMIAQDGDNFTVKIPALYQERVLIFQPGADGKTYTFGLEPEPTAGYLKKEKALHKALKTLAKDPSSLRLEQGHILEKLSGALPVFVPTPQRSGLFDWTPSRSGKSKGTPKWYKDLASEGSAKNPKRPFSITTQMAPYLLGVQWVGRPIRYRKIGNKGGWVDYRGVPLPHPSGGENLGTPFCKDYLAYVTSGTLTSLRLSSEELTDVFRHILLSGQWTQFRGRYHGIYVQESQDYPGLKFVKPDINPCGTVTGRAKSSVWVVTPNERKIFDGSIKIGSNIQNNIVPPPGYKVVGADFTSEESWLATLLADAQAGKIASNPWCQSVLYGQKANKTDIHNIVAQALSIGRNPAKSCNFAKQYGCGVAKLVTLMMLAGVAPEVAEAKAKDFVALLQGPEGIAKAVFGTLRELSQVSGIRTAILGCRVPESLDAQYCGRNFVTSRQNWLIQSAGVDVIHVLFTVLNAFLIEYEVDAILLLHRHDAVYYAVKEGQEDVFQRCLQQAHLLTKLMAYEQAVAQANNLNAAKGNTVAVKTPPLNCPDSQKWFDEVKVKDSVGAAG